MSSKTSKPKTKCIVLKVWDCEFNKENDSRVTKINSYLFYPTSEIYGIPIEEVKKTDS